MKISDVFTSGAIAADWNRYLEENNDEPLLGEAFFPDKKKLGLDLKFIKGASGVPVALQPSAFDALATVRDRIGFTVMQDEMPYFKESYLIKEADRQELLRIQESSSPYAEAVVSNIYGDVRDLIIGARVTRERMRWQLLTPTTSTPMISISINGTPKDYNYDPNGEWAATNYLSLSGTSAWTAYTTADPLKDLEDAVEALETASGVRPAYVVMNLKTFNDIKKCDSIKQYIVASSANGRAIINRESVTKLLEDELKLSIIVYTKKFRATQTSTAQTYIPDNVVTLLPGEVGDTVFGTSPFEADKLANVGGDTSIIDTGVAVKVVNTGEHSELCQTQSLVGMVTLPSYEGMNNVYVIKTA